MIVDDVDSKEDPIDEDPPSLYECLEMVRRLRVLSNTQQPELHPFLMQLQSKLTDVLLNSNISKQRSIYDYFKSMPLETGVDLGTSNVLILCDRNG